MYGDQKMKGVDSAQVVTREIGLDIGVVKVDGVDFSIEDWLDHNLTREVRFDMSCKMQVDDNESERISINNL